MSESPPPLPLSTERPLTGNFPPPLPTGTGATKAVPPPLPKSNTSKRVSESAAPPPIPSKAAHTTALPPPLPATKQLQKPAVTSDTGPVSAKNDESVVPITRRRYGNWGIFAVASVVLLGPIAYDQFGALNPSGPSPGDIRQAMQRQLFAKGMGVEERKELGGEMKLTIDVLRITKVGCIGADSGDYDCQYEIDTETQQMGNSTKQHGTTSGRFVNTPSGWAIVGG